MDGDGRDINLIFSDAKFKRKGNNEEYKITRDKKFKSTLSFDLNKCCYCFKVFLNTTFLIKHLLRRHSDKLIKRQNVADSDCNNSFKDFVQYDLFQNMLETMKFFNHMISNTLKDEFVPVQEEITDLKIKFSKIEGKLLSLEEAFDCMNSKQSVSEANILDETKLNSNLRETLSEFQSSVLQNSESYVTYMSYITDLRAKIERLEFFIKANSDKINSLQSISLEVKKELEVELKNRLEKDLTMILSNVEDVKSLKGTYHTSKNPVSQMAKKKKTHKHFGKKNSSKKILSLSSAELPLEEKLKILSVSADIERLSTCDYDTKIRCIQAEKEALSNKYKSFLGIRNNLDSYSNELVLSKLKDQKSKKKLRFLLPNSSSTNLKSDLALNNFNLNARSSVCYTTKQKGIQNSSASIKLFDHQNNCKISDTSYNSAEELSPVCILDSKEDCEKAKEML